jgi:cytochrome c-type biogenesis protein CcmH/NrfF
MRGGIGATAAGACAGRTPGSLTGLRPGLFVGLLLGLAAIVAIACMPGSAGALEEPPAGQAATGVEQPAPPAAPAPVDPASSWAYDLAGELMSPFCPGRTLASCPSPQAGEMIQWIAMQEAAGSTREEVVAILVERHGEEILGAPRARGIGLWAYLLPVMGFIGFGGVVVLVLRRIVAPAARTAGAAGAAGGASDADVRPGLLVATATATATATASSASSDELARIVDAELAKRA